jgi:hypothetical protein
MFFLIREKIGSCFQPFSINTHFPYKVNPFCGIEILRLRLPGETIELNNWVGNRYRTRFSVAGKLVIN